VDLLGPFVIEARELYAEHAFVTMVEAELGGTDAIPVAMGSGTINDLVKLASHRSGRPYMCVATAASMDGYTAFGASITFEGAKQTFSCPAPVAVIADMDIIRCAPAGMSASGYADLLSKVTAGADWILADALGEEPLDPQAWDTVQGGLLDALADPSGIRRGDPDAFESLTEGLMLGGLAMQCHQTSRPASGAEHQFSHLWDMQHHTFGGSAPSHGFKVGIATLAVTALYEKLLELPVEAFDPETIAARWRGREEWNVRIRELFPEADLRSTALRESDAKYRSRDEVGDQMRQLQEIWPDLKTKLQDQLLPFGTIKRMLNEVGAPTAPEMIGISRSRLRRSFELAYFIRRRFTVLDLVTRAGQLESCLDEIFGANGVWPEESMPVSAPARL